VRRKRVRRRDYGPPWRGDASPGWSLAIDEFRAAGLPGRIAAGLASAGITGVADLIERAWDGPNGLHLVVSTAPNCGVRSVALVKALRERGLGR
jgi:hypothetical protein